MARPQQQPKGGLKPVPKASDVPPQMQASLLHLGTMMGHPGDQDFSAEVEKHLGEMEANQKKMEAAQRGGSSEMGPSQFETQQADQTQALQQQATIQGAQQAQQAQGAQMPQNVPVEAPGPAGESAPYPAQAGPPPAPTSYKPPPGGS